MRPTHTLRTFAAGFGWLLLTWAFFTAGVLFLGGCVSRSVAPRVASTPEVAAAPALEDEVEHAKQFEAQAQDRRQRLRMRHARAWIKGDSLHVRVRLAQLDTIPAWFAQIYLNTDSDRSYGDDEGTDEFVARFVEINWIPYWWYRPMTGEGLYPIREADGYGPREAEGYGEATGYGQLHFDFPRQNLRVLHTSIPLSAIGNDRDGMLLRLQLVIYPDDSYREWGEWLHMEVPAATERIATHVSR